MYSQLLLILWNPFTYQIACYCAKEDLCNAAYMNVCKIVFVLFCHNMINILFSFYCRNAFVRVLPLLMHPGEYNMLSSYISTIIKIGDLRNVLKHYASCQLHATQIHAFEIKWIYKELVYCIGVVACEMVG